jgi:hypothetical protein
MIRVSRDRFYKILAEDKYRQELIKSRQTIFKL